jgi:hypothetical protein
MAALADYIDFGGLGFVASQSPFPSPALSAARNFEQLRKGMTSADVERLLGSPAESSRKTTGDITVETLVFLAGEYRLTAEFVEDLLVRYTIASQ